MKLNDVEQRSDLEVIIKKFYERVLVDPIIGFIFVNIVKVDLETHLPVIINFWSDVLFKQPLLNNKDSNNKLYQGNLLNKHLQVHSLIALKPGHFTRWLYLFNEAVDENYSGENSELIKERAEAIAQSISAAITEQKKSSMKLVLPKVEKLL